MFASALACAACAGPERPLLEEFFAASRLRDRTALQKISTTIFEPRERGIVRRFEIVNVSSGDVTGRKNVTLTALVAAPDGQTVRKSLNVTLEVNTSGQWLVTAVAEPGFRP